MEILQLILTQLVLFWLSFPFLQIEQHWPMYGMLYYNIDIYMHGILPYTHNGFTVMFCRSGDRDS